MPARLVQETKSSICQSEGEDKGVGVVAGKITWPVISILDNRFMYRVAGKTDVSKTFSRIRRKMKEEAEKRAEEEKNVVQLRKTK